MANKIKYGISDVHYAPITTTGFGTPVALPGAVSISLAAEGERSPFNADNVEYFVTNVNNGYTGTLEVALFDDDARVALLGEVLDNTSKNLYEKASGAEAPKFALGFKVKGDAKDTCFWFYNCTLARPQVNAQTKADNIEPNTDTLDITCRPDANGYVRVKSTEDTASLSGWFTSVVATPS